MPRIDWSSTIPGGLAALGADIPEFRGFEDPFSSTIDQFNDFKNPRALAETFTGSLQLGESFFTAGNLSGWGLPTYEFGYGGALDLVIKARDFLSSAMNALAEIVDLGGQLVADALEIAGEVLENIVGPVIQAVTGAIPIIGQVVQAVTFVYRAMDRLLKWLNRSGPKPQPPAPLARPVYSAAADLDRTRETLGLMAARTTGSSPRMTSFFSPPVWSEDTLDPAYTDIVLQVKALGMWGLLEWAKLDDGTKLVRQRHLPTQWNWGSAAWGTGYQAYDASFPSLVPGSGIGNGNPGMVHTGMLVLSRDKYGRIQCTDLAARFPQYAQVPGPMMGQISRYGPSLYSLHASALRQRWEKYLRGWFWGLARASGQLSWAYHAGLQDLPSTNEWLSQPGKLADTYQWQNLLTREEAWSIRAYFGNTFSTLSTPRSNSGPYPELDMGITQFSWRDVLLHPKTSIPYMAMDDLYKRQELCLYHGATPLYLQPDDDALASTKVGPDGTITMRQLWNDRIDELGTFASTKDAGIICSPALEPSMVIDPQVQQMIADKRLASGVGNISACQVWKMSTFQIAEDPATPAQPGAMIQVGATEIPDDDEDTGGGGGGGMALAAVGILAAALALGRKK